MPDVGVPAIVAATVTAFVSGGTYYAVRTLGDVGDLAAIIPTVDLRGAPY